MLGKCIPKLEGPLGISCAEATDEMVFERLDGTFSCVNSVVCWFDKLPSAALFCQILFDWRGGLIVSDIKGRLETLVLELGEHFFERCDN